MLDILTVIPIILDMLLISIVVVQFIVITSMLLVFRVITCKTTRLKLSTDLVPTITNDEPIDTIKKVKVKKLSSDSKSCILFDTILFITTNKYKAMEATDIAKLKNMTEHFKVISCDDIPSMPEVHEIQEFDVETVSVDKVKKVYDIISKIINFENRTDKTKQLLIVCEDTGLYLEGGYMHGFPGAFFKQFCETVGNDVCKIHANGKAIARTAVSFYDGKTINTFIGETVGTIIKRPQDGLYGFGFDSCFRPDNFDKTFSQMTPTEKNQISMRKIAFAKLFDWYLTQKNA